MGDFPKGFLCKRVRAVNRLFIGQKRMLHLLLVAIGGLTPERRLQFGRCNIILAEIREGDTSSLPETYDLPRYVRRAVPTPHTNASH